MTASALERALHIAEIAHILDRISGRKPFLKLTTGRKLVIPQQARSFCAALPDDVVSKFQRQTRSSTGVHPSSAISRHYLLVRTVYLRALRNVTALATINLTKLQPAQH